MLFSSCLSVGFLNYGFPFVIQCTVYIDVICLTIQLCLQYRDDDAYRSYRDIHMEYRS